MPVASRCCSSSVRLASRTGRPFDNAEAEQSWSGVPHRVLVDAVCDVLLAEYAHMITGMSFFTLLFLGGYHLPFVPWLEPDVYGSGFWPGFAIVFLKFFVFFTKVMGLICFQMVIRWTLPRLRYDQVMMLNCRT
ncbi:MAG: NADH-quinone oxidoreductase subunit H [Phycisphaerales bacterium]